MKNIFFKRPVFYLLLFYYFIGLGVQGVEVSLAQGFNIYHPAEVIHPWVSEINPAVISAQFTRVAVGLKVFHLGFLPGQSLAMRESRINASFPFYLPLDLGTGCDLRYFSAGIYSELTASLMVSRRILSNLSLGMKIGVGHYGFAREDFHLVDLNDPLLAGGLGKTSLNLGFGLFYNPGNWTMGIGLDHLNRPDVGRQTSAPLPMEISTAVGYQVGRFIPSLLLHHDGTYVRYGVAIAARQERFGQVRLSFESTMPFKVEAQFQLSRDNSLHYGVDLPTDELSSVSLGSHEIVFTRILDRGPDIGQPTMRLSTDSMRIHEETVVRSMSPGLTSWQISSISGLVPEFLDVNGSGQNMLVIPTGPLSRYETDAIRKQRYARLGQEIKQKLQEHPEVSLILQTDDQSLGDARSLKQYLVQTGICKAEAVGIARVNSSGKLKLDGFEPGQMTQTRKKAKCSDEKLVINLELPGKIKKVKEWSLFIKNHKQEVVRTIKGIERLPEMIEWDWKDEWGVLVSPGQYSCHLVVKSLTGQERLAQSIPIHVSRTSRTVYLRFSPEKSVHASKLNP
ncbi:MAG: type IX secretion system membrane protein PorP/SprF [candidate division KSB1 bacterium]|nr:type IX secretion system membrane protein PorP/SprF [candidate division KSB1 bacterium]MDZ7334161.1 type IX secretion system membrane protein PorP/SprF [candidate division KSB1 bacterium]MDZ7357332.1 type IX secretion system membrane protein PorP/SprF [candidate division KSB1 bacterium]MDZ7375047.1 type IX secretion system membrane protein PorP/SprF [candidate division KSB1 bacterium]MDZ7400854.1 type IX secretion system membrane protein PorP/SprF [candidate division KSB1 bacterium]